MTSFGGKAAARSLGGRLASKTNSPLVSPVGNKMTYAIAGVIPYVAPGAWAGLTGSAYGGGTKPFPVVLENTGGVISWQIGANPSSTPRDVFVADITSWVGKSFFAIIRQNGTGDHSRLDLYIDGVKLQYIAPTQNIVTTGALGGLTLLGFEDSNGNWDAPFAYFGAMGGWPSDAQVSAMLDWAAAEYHLDPTAVDPMATLSLVYDSAGIAGSVGAAGTVWTPSKGTGTLGEIDPGAPLVATLGAKKALRSNGGRLAIRGAAPAVAASGNKLTYVFAGVVPTIASGAHAGCSGSAASYGGSKAFPLAVANSGGVYNWRWANVEGGTADVIPYNMAAFVGLPFFAVQRCLGASGTTEYSKLDIYINGARRHYEAATRNISSIGNLGGLTLLGFEELNGNWDAPFAYFGAMPGWPTDVQALDWLQWAKAEYSL
ncbi:MAG TPA: hypothetical protein VLC09_09185 [Polyangiaceae bacterium]|nr:hypothetical protein [Polyangiaceae bacterium]